MENRFIFERTPIKTSAFRQRSIVNIIASIVLLLSIVAIAPVFADAADNNAEQFLARTALLTREQIRTAELQAESKFGANTAFRWDAFVNPNLRIYCGEYTGYKSPKSEDAKKVISWVYRYTEAATNNRFNVRASPLRVYVIGMGEGFINSLRDITCYDISLDNEISGFDSLGLDHFADEAHVLKAGGFLRQDFNEGDEYKPITKTNECKAQVRSAIFKNTEYGIEALAARVTYAKYVFERDARTFGVDVSRLSEDQSNFWTYYYFNLGQGRGKQELGNHISGGILDDSAFIKAPGQTIINGRNTRYNSIIRTSTASFIRSLGMF